ncbi:MAG: TRAP transporter small permease subunit, partial [Oscillospiraceae bacterium]|nr:TRAP transporter small permease subunit [Oscillospiraceae bacterium]
LCIIIIVFGFQQSMSIFRMGRVSSGLKISMGYVYLILPVGYTLTSIRIIQNWILDIIAYSKRDKIGNGGEAK